MGQGKTEGHLQEGEIRITLKDSATDQGMMQGAHFVAG